MKSRTPSATYEQVVVALFSLGWLASVVVVANWAFFFVDPFVTHNNLRRLELVLFIAGWVLLTLGPVFIAIRMLLVTDEDLRYLRVIALLYPLAVLSIQVTLYVQSHVNSRHFYQPYSYLQSNYWFVVTDIVVPLALLALDAIVRKSREEHNFAPESEQAHLVAADSTES